MRGVIMCKTVKEIEMPSITTNQRVREAIMSVLYRHGKKSALEILQRYGACSVRELNPTDYALVIEDCENVTSAAKLVELFRSVPPWAPNLPLTSERKPMPPLKLQMLLHFAGAAQPFAPESTRRSEAYVLFVKELLRDGLIERPTKKQRALHEGWAYKATPRGHCFVKALTEMPLPVRVTPEWVMPAK